MSRFALLAVLSVQQRWLARLGRTRGFALSAGATELEDSVASGFAHSDVVPTLAVLVTSG